MTKTQKYFHPLQSKKFREGYERIRANNEKRPLEGEFLCSVCKQVKDIDFVSYFCMVNYPEQNCVECAARVQFGTT